MTKKLKTLKDFETEMCNLSVSELAFADMVEKKMKEQLKAEAIKWVKVLQPEALLNIKDVKKQMLVDWIFNFFNLTEEDLK